MNLKRDGKYEKKEIHLPENRENSNRYVMSRKK